MIARCFLKWSPSFAVIVLLQYLYSLFTVYENDRAHINE